MVEIMFNLNKTWLVAIDRKTGQVVDASQPNERDVQFVRKDFTGRFKSPRFALTEVNTPTLENFFDDRTCQEIYNIVKVESHKQSSKACLNVGPYRETKTLDAEPSLRGFICGKPIRLAFSRKRKRERK